MILSSGMDETSINRFSVLVTILSSAIAVIPFYLVGMAQLDGYREALGLSYLSTPSAGEYISVGAATLLIGGFVVSYLVVFLVIALLYAFGLKRWHIPRNLEVVCIFGIAFIDSVFILIRLLRDERIGHEVMRTSSCPINGESAYISAFLLLLSTMFVVALIAIVIHDKRYRLVFLAWGAVACLACLWNFGWSNGAGAAYGEFSIAEITEATAKTQTVLLLDADDKNLVVVFKKDERPYQALSLGSPASQDNKSEIRHPVPVYLLRSDLRSMQLIGFQSLDGFFCNTPIKTKH